MEKVAQEYVYYITRDILPGLNGSGTCPKENFIRCDSYREPLYVPTIQREALGAVYYSKPLTKDEIQNYELYAPCDIKSICKMNGLMVLNSDSVLDLQQDKDLDEHGKENIKYIELLNSHITPIQENESRCVLVEKKMLSTMYPNEKEIETLVASLDYLNDTLEWGTFENGCDIAINKQGGFCLLDYNKQGKITVYTYHIVDLNKQFDTERVNSIMSLLEEEGVQMNNYVLYGEIQFDKEMDKCIKKDCVKAFKEIKKDSLNKDSHVTDCRIHHKSEQKKSKTKNVEIEER